MNKLIILLKQLNIIEDVNVLLHASLKKVIVHHDNHYTFYESWKLYYDAIKEADPNAAVGGPNDAAYSYLIMVLIFLTRLNL